jgi:hypothetical protein
MDKLRAVLRDDTMFGVCHAPSKKNGYFLYGASKDPRNYLIGDQEFWDKVASTVGEDVFYDKHVLVLVYDWLKKLH